MEEKFELATIYSQRKSFNHKAFVIAENDNLTLVSYGIKIMTVNLINKKFTKLWDSFSKTTWTHILEFSKQNNIPMSKKLWDSLGKDEQYIYES